MAISTVIYWIMIAVIVSVGCVVLAVVFCVLKRYCCGGSRSNDEGKNDHKSNTYKVYRESKRTTLKVNHPVDDIEKNEGFCHTLEQKSDHESPIRLPIKPVRT